MEVLVKGTLADGVDQIDVAVNAPEAGTIKELLAKEEDTVTVGQDIVKMELGGEPAGGHKEEAKQEPKNAASDQQPTSSDPKPSKDGSKSSEPEKPTQPSPPKEPERGTQQPPKSTPRQEPSAHDKPPESASSSKATEHGGSASQSPYGSREERRV